MGWTSEEYRCGGLLREGGRAGAPSVVRSTASGMRFLPPSLFPAASRPSVDVELLNEVGFYLPGSCDLSKTDLRGEKHAARSFWVKRWD
jgi:hypothetical protein